MAFRYPYCFFLLGLFILLWVIWSFRSKKQLILFPGMSKKVQTHLFSSLDMLRLTWKNRFFFWGLLFLGLAILGPQIGTRIKPVERKGVDLVFA